MKGKIVMIVILAFFINDTYSQRKKSKNNSKKEEAEEVIEIQLDVEVMEDIQQQKQITLDGESYRTSRINNDYSWFYDENNTYGVIDKLGKIILPCLFKKNYSSYLDSDESIILTLGSHVGVFDLNEMTWIIPLEYQSLSRMSNTSGYFIAKKEGNYGIIDRYQKAVIPFNWESLRPISGLNNYFIVSVDANPSDLYGIYSLLDAQLVVPCIYSSLSQISGQTYFKVERGTKHNIINVDNIPQFKTWYDELYLSSNRGNYYIVSLNNRMGVIDSYEKEIVPLKYLEIAQNSFSDGSHLARDSEGKYGFMRIDGTVTLPFVYDNLNKRYNNNIVSVQNGKCGIVQVNSGVPTEIITCDYDNIRNDGNNYAIIVEKDGKYGMLDKYGSVIAEPKFEELELLEDGSGFIYKGKINEKYTLIDQRGEQILNKNYPNIVVVPSIPDKVNYYNRTSFNYLKVEETKGKFSLIDKVGRSVDSPKFEDIKLEAQNHLVVKSSGKYGLFSLLRKNVIEDFTYDQITFDNGRFYGFINNDIYLLTLQGDQLLKEKL